MDNHTPSGRIESSDVPAQYIAVVACHFVCSGHVGCVDGFVVATLEETAYSTIVWAQRQCCVLVLRLHLDVDMKALTLSWV